MQSFYGGRRGQSFELVRTYPSIVASNNLDALERFIMDSMLLLIVKILIEEKSIKEQVIQEMVQVEQYLLELYQAKKELAQVQLLKLIILYRMDKT